MKIVATVLCMLISLVLSAQKIEKYFNHKWEACEPAAARFYEVVVKTDSGWHCQNFYISGLHLQMDGTYADSSRKVENGMFYYFYPNNSLESSGKYVNGNREGQWLRYYPNGTMSDSLFYENGHVAKNNFSWHTNGMMRDSSVWQADGSGVSVKWYDNGNVSFAGQYKNWEEPFGKWQFFHDNGKISSLETFSNAALISKEYFDENGNSMDTTDHDHEAMFSGGVKAWGNWLYKHLYFPDRYKLVNADEAVVVVRFIINEDGTVSDADVVIPFAPQFDKIAVDAIKRSPKWIPAVSHNRRIKGYVKQPVTFQQNSR